MSPRLSLAAVVLAAWACGAAQVRAQAPASGGPAPAACPGEPCHGSHLLVFGGGEDDALHAFGSLGIVLGDVRYVGPVVASGRGVLVQADVGSSGGALNLGFPVPFTKLPLALNYRGEWKRLSIPAAGVMLKASVVRTWRREESLPPDQTYLGVGLEVSVLVQLRVSRLYRVDGQAGPRAAWTVGVGLGL